MKQQNITEMARIIIDWAKEQGKIHPDEIRMKKIKDDNGETHFIREIPDEDKKFVEEITKTILSLDNSTIRGLEDELLHIPEEKSFNVSQVVLLNAIRSVVFLEQERRNTPKQIESGE